MLVNKKINEFVPRLQGKWFGNEIRQKLSGNDFSVNVLPLLKGRVQTWLTKNYFFDIGTPEALKKARSIFYWK